MTMKKIGEGAESCIYSVELLGIGSVLKRRGRKYYRLKELDENLRARRTKNEARITSHVSGLGIDSPKVLLVGKYDIYMSKLQGESLHLLLNDGDAVPDSVFVTLGEYAASMHNNGIVHGDFTPANVMVEGVKVHLIDFGLSEFNDSPEEKALDLLLMKRSVSKLQFAAFLKGYGSCNDYGKIIARLSGIEKRGRYNTRTLLID